MSASMPLNESQKTKTGFEHKMFWWKFYKTWQDSANNKQEITSALTRFWRINGKELHIYEDGDTRKCCKR